MRVIGKNHNLKIERSYITRVVSLDFRTEVIVIDHHMFPQKWF